MYSTLTLSIGMLHWPALFKPRATTCPSRPAPHACCVARLYPPHPRPAGSVGIQSIPSVQATLRIPPEVPLRFTHRSCLALWLTARGRGPALAVPAAGRFARGRALRGNEEMRK